MKTTILISLFIAGVFSELRFVSEVSRHGARASSTIYNYTVNPEDNFKAPMELTEMGMRQHYLIGTQVRKTYIEKHKLIPSTYNISEVSFFSTDRTRTLESGMSQLSGIYPPAIWQQQLNEWQQKNAVPPVPIDDLEKIQKELKEKALPDCYNLLPIISETNPKSYDIQCQDSDWKAYHEISDMLWNSEEQAELKEPYLDFLLPTFEEHIGGDIKEEDVDPICSYLTLADLHKLKLTFDWWKYKGDETTEMSKIMNSDLYSDIIKNWESLTNVQLYWISYGDERLWKIGAKMYLDKLVASMDKIVSGEPTPKVELNFSHDRSLAIILSGLGYVTKVNPPLASTLFIELHEENGTFHVETFYNGKPLTYGLCKEKKCSYETFKENVKQRTFPGSIDDVCNGEITW